MERATSDSGLPQADPDRRLILAARAILILHREFERAARHADITIPQYRFLLTLKRGASRARELASDSAIGKPTASALITEMEKRGLIAREPDARDGRSTLLRLTDEGIARHAAFERALAGALAGFVPLEGSEAILQGFTDLAYRIDQRRGA